MRKVTMVVELQVELNDDTVDPDDLCLDFEMSLIDVITVNDDGTPFGVGHITEYTTKEVIVHDQEG